MGSNGYILCGALVVVLSYFFNLVAKRTNVPAVLMLIVLGLFIRAGAAIGHQPIPDLLPVLGVLGTIGLIMIVLEAALDLKLAREKLGLIMRALVVAVGGLFGAAFAGAWLLNVLLIDDFYTALLYATPLSILSSAIVVPSVGSLSEEKREFMVYESTLSDILGIILFYTVLVVVQKQSAVGVGEHALGNIGLSILASLVVSYLLILVFQNIKTHIKLFLLVAVLLVLYSLGKIFHLSSLLVILTFGLVLNNYQLFFRGFLLRLLNIAAVEEIREDFKVITAETAFVVRTFFFVLFGMSVVLSSITFKVVVISLLLLVLFFGVRILFLRLVNGRHIMPEAYLAPRGLITILLFFAIPENLVDKNFEPGILLFIILATSIAMSVVLVQHRRRQNTDNIDLNNEDANPAETFLPGQEVDL